MLPTTQEEQYILSLILLQETKLFCLRESRIEVTGWLKRSCQRREDKVAKVRKLICGRMIVG